MSSHHQNQQSLAILATPAFRNRSSNAYNSILYSTLQNEGLQILEKLSWSNLHKANFWHIHWPESFLNDRYLVASLYWLTLFLWRYFLCKIFGLKIIWTVHNIRPHESRYPYLERWFYRWFPQKCQGLIFLSQYSQKEFFAQTPTARSVPFLLTRHGHYQSILNANITQKQAREKLNLQSDRQIWLFFGMLRSYKNLPNLIRTFKVFHQPNCHLYLWGSPGTDKRIIHQLQQEIGQNTNIHLTCKRLSESELEYAVKAADRIIIPYKKVTNSGSIIYALSCGKAVLSTRVGSLPEIQKYVGSQALVLAENPLQVEDMESFEQLDLHCPNIKPFDPFSIAQEHIAFYSALT
ncbi:MAG: glycosyltransferase [Jaaginema sp. PMC 1079.18]|nr:glycosyltransferase [Jaaginema sp. PMC 1080.18]MEC4853590.1 glycosyltransferase [Jaaginema sp. PMC 1079.18]MEC4866183.1 glycosyltransferase [Jaaginema sp. PMC 1078.18]